MSKPINWRGSSLKDLREFPDEAKSNAGYQLHRVQEGEEPTAFKPFPDIGPGVKEIIVEAASGWYRVMYVAKFEEAVYVLHAFQKKTNKTSENDKEIAKKRYNAVLEERKKR